METKPLTEAQRNHLAALLTERNRAQAAADQFVAYLYAEHGLSAEDGWTRIDVGQGFIRETPPTPPAPPEPVDPEEYERHDQPG